MKFSKEFFDFQEELALNSDLQSIGKTVLKHAVPATRGQAGLFLYLAPGASHFQLVATRGYPDSLVRDWQHCSPDRDLPLPIAIRMGEPLFVKSTAALPVGEPNFCFAGFSVSYEESSVIPLEEQEFLKMVANETRVALDQLSGEGGI